jgi:hypothetical protein
MKLIALAHGSASCTPTCPKLARDLFAPALEREKLLRLSIETS